jgi:hypothetical protein
MIDDFAKKSLMRPVRGTQINDRQYKPLICKVSENDTFRLPQLNIGSQKAAIRLFVTLSMTDEFIKSPSISSASVRTEVGAAPAPAAWDGFTSLPRQWLKEIFYEVISD